MKRRPGSEEALMSDQSAGYGGSRWAKWLLLYLAIGAVLYAIIYFVFLQGGGGGSGGGSGGGGYALLALRTAWLQRHSR